MATALQQTLRSLCFQTGWCYAVFWKLKRRSRMVLTWEDGYYECKKPSTISKLSSTQMAPSSLLADGNGCLETVANPLDQGVSGRESNYVEEQIGLAVAKMSYQVYALGEGIIGRVSFTEKHNWVYSSGLKSMTDANSGSGSNNRSVVEKHPAEWQNQFAVGIKTIVVIAVPQGVVQLGSTQMITEDLELVDHIKAVFRTFHGVPGAFVSDQVSEGKGGKGRACPTYLTSMSPIGSTTVVGRQSALHRVHPSQRNTKLFDSLGRTTPGRVGLNSNSEHPQTILSCTEFGGTAQMVLQQSKLQEPHSNLETPTLMGLGTGPMTSGLRPTSALASLLQSDGSISGNQQLPLLKSKGNSDTHKIMEQGLCKEPCPPGQHTVSLNKTVTDLQSQGHLNALTTLRNSLMLPSKGSPQQANATARPVGQEFSGRSDGSLRTCSTNGVEQLITTQLDVQDGVPFCQNGGVPRNQLCQNGIPFQNRSFSKDGWVPNVQLQGQNLCLESCKTQPIKNIAKSEELMGKVDQFIASSWDLSTDHLDSLCLESISMAKSPLAKGLFSSNDSPLDQKVWDTDGFEKSISISGLQSKVENPIKTIVQESNTAYIDLPVNSSYDRIHGDGGFDDLEKYVASFASRQDRNWNCSFPIGDELSQVLGQTFKKGHDMEFWEEILLQSNANQIEGNNDQTMFGIPGCPSNWAEAALVQSSGSSIGRDEFSKDAVGGLYLSESKSEQLLEVAIGDSNISQGTTQNPGDNVSCKAAFSGIDSGHSALKSSDNVDYIPRFLNAGTEQLCLNHIPGPLWHGDLDKKNGTRHDSDSRGSLPLEMSPVDFTRKGMLNSWIEGQSMKSDNMQSSQTKKVGENTKISRKRARPGESTRPRPKDRQQIQDRVRELREIVPNGSKCSIDALLEKTIKHMLFLQSVNQHADKLKQSGELKVLNNGNSFLPLEKMDGGASWALELGGQGMGCPIIVENLNQPRQMLVEMVCEERELFFEIADIIRGLDLTILKGIMESRSDKVWARLVVEAKRDVHRVEILLSLMPLLQPNTKNSSSVTSHAGPIRPESMDSSPKGFPVFQQVSQVSLQMNESLQ